MITKRLCLFCIVLLYMLLGLVSAEDITLYHPSDGDGCVVGDYINFTYTPVEVSLKSCNLYANDTGVWGLTDNNVSISVGVVNSFRESLLPGSILWEIICTNQTDDFYSENRTFTYKNAPYCAVLNNAQCTPNPNVNSMAVAKAQLSNSRGFFLENQDCNVFITNSRGEPVKAFDSMLYMQTVGIQLDKEGNWINVADKKVPLTDSEGWYVFPFLIDRDWAWVGDEYNIHIVCNGQEAICNFNVTSDRLPDTNNYEQIGINAGGTILFILIILYLIARYGKTLISEIWRKR
jgi:hypothetical protein